MRKAIRPAGALDGPVFCSHAVRARQTLQGLIRGGPRPAIHIERMLYTFHAKALKKNAGAASHLRLSVRRSVRLKCVRCTVFTLTRILKRICNEIITGFIFLRFAEALGNMDARAGGL